ncbi:MULTISPECIES: 3-carboxy-cis,cis-muconate cycloisomerase [Stutzerimonas]|uniref:3-carboxy-cis,cis-muconate cycloisomerase n=3 Tax=Stutzerimonas stutzeri TaxID=316 RepID=A4VJ01_STUS1|nr:MULTISPECIES: 3-carboxy-cis,cis-muconate cycloisomerase [Stutzerimonas]EPL60955.1 3-carboxy-cis,cis-muconate cycloisomerase [Stutzerimonas stutzeri B1SMN1]OHC21144.1 MAG: 3-carboxy-cis,cis-muconate cycloisomerase [Pseudomonadales bacterium RIFCSPHIGHO2_01_FULL_64_12]HAN52179.1 3-carboxy-cis,cis-muconate cycloisomerase [Pseudomonas sp.]ABP78952.1 3-carboxy-cis,cis-muconate cycloisomerase [Stutzerimonas stutzeri A1501]MBH3355634.1 3-carboxy-cis,cis-muconate cycloisomerase [Stutzerimonas stutz
MDRPSNQLFDVYFTSAPMREVFSDRGRVQGMLDFEAALARAEARTGVIPATAVDAIEAACHAEHYDLCALAEAVATAGNSAIPLVKALGRQVAANDPDAEKYVHLGATSQDAMDSGLVLQLRQALALLETDLRRLGDALADQAARHAETPMAGRTWLQHATPVTLGMKIAGWLGAVTRHRQRLAELRPRLLCLQFGGASGSLAALGEQAWPVSEALAGELGLNLPDQPWHTQRDRLVEFASLLGLIAGSLGKLGRDLALLMQTDVGEVFEPAAPGKGGSSTMPHKRNPVGCAVMIAAATRAPGLVATMLSALPQEHERSLGLWLAEWETLPELCCLVSGALSQALIAVPALEVDGERLRGNLELTRGLVLAEAVSIALAQLVGREKAHELVEQCCKQAVAEGRHLRGVLRDSPEVSSRFNDAELDRLLDPANYLGQARRWVERAVAEHHALNE